MRACTPSGASSHRWHGLFHSGDALSWVITPANLIELTRKSAHLNCELIDPDLHFVLHLAPVKTAHRAHVFTMGCKPTLGIDLSRTCVPFDPQMLGNELMILDSEQSCV